MPSDVRELDPLDGVDVDREVPAVDLDGTDPEEERVEAGHHEPLDVMGVAELERLAEDVREAGHLRIPRPEEGGQRAVGAERVLLEVLRHAEPVDPADELPPAEDLPHEPLDRLNRRSARAPCRFRPTQDLPRVEELQVHRGGEARVEEERLAGPHRVLEAAEGGEAVREEVVEGTQGRRAGHRPIEAVEAPGVRGEAPGNEIEDLARRRVGSAGEGRAHRPGSPGAKARAVRRVEVEGASRGALALHQEAGLPPHLAVEELHPELPAPLRPLPELRGRAQEVPVGQDLETRDGREQFLLHPPLARLDDDDPLGAEPVHGLRELGPEGRLGELDVRDVAAVGAEIVAEVAHRREEERDARLVRPDLLALRGDLRHEDPVAFRVEAVERRRRGVELVPEDDDEGSRVSQRGNPPPLRSRSPAESPSFGGSARSREPGGSRTLGKQSGTPRRAADTARES